MKDLKENSSPFITISHLITMLENHTPVPLRLEANLELKVLCPGPDDGDRGDIPTTTPLAVPETVSLIISPLGCSLHVTETGRGTYNSGRSWILCLEEYDIVSGDYLDKIDRAVGQIIQDTPSIVKGLILCGTCIDVLLGTDYDFYADHLSKKYGIRVSAQIMGPILKGTPGSGLYHMYTAIYRLLRFPAKPIAEKSVNILGILKAPSPDSEFPALLRDAGIDKIYYIGDFTSLEACDNMICSLLNIVVCENALTAAEEMKRKFQIPYVVLLPSYDPDTIHEYYRKISEALNLSVDDGFYYKKSRKLLHLLRTKAADITCAVGERNISPVLNVALDTIALGFRLEAVFLRKAASADLPMLRKIAAKNPDTRIYYDTHPGMWNYIHSPQNYDISFGVPFPYLRNTPYTMDAPIHFPYIDYATLERLMTRISRLLDCRRQTHSVPEEDTIPNKRRWVTYRQERKEL